MPRRKRLRILLTNDDGLDAPGLAALEAALPDGSEVVVAAPSVEYSGCSHQVTTNRPIRVRRLTQRKFSVESMPADCVRVALHGDGGRFDWVMAGINHGGNLGVDVYYSGTVAAAREATLYGIPAIAISHYRDREFVPDDWRRATAWVRGLLPELLGRPLPAGGFWNVNLPSLPAGAGEPPLVDCEVDTSPLQLTYGVDGESYSYTGVYRQRGRQRGCDVDTCFGGSIAVSLLRLP